MSEHLIRLTASDFVSYYRPTRCDLRVLLRYRGEGEEPAGPYGEALLRLGLRHEDEHLKTLGEYVDVRDASIEVQARKTADAIAERVPVLYQATFLVTWKIKGTEVEIIGVPDFLILNHGGYIIRDCKIARRVDVRSHPEILLQVQLYGWLFERSCGVVPEGLEVYTGTGEIVAVPYDGGVSALRELEHILAIKQLTSEQYEPVGWSKCLGCGFTSRCWSKAEQNSDIALVYCVDQSLARTLNERGIRSRRDLLAKFDATALGDVRRPRGKREQRVGKTAGRIMQFAAAMEEGREMVLAVPAVPPSRNYVMFDLEGMPPHLDELDKIYLWGMQVFGEEPGEFIPALAGFGSEGDKEGWLRFLANAKRILETRGNLPFVHWASYERTYLRRYVGRFGDPEGIAARVEENLLDLLTVTRDSVVLPLPSLSLKVVEDYVGFERSELEFGGQWAMATFIEATETRDEVKRGELMRKILAYNKEDLEATWAVFNWLRSKTPAESPGLP